jgi:hypothetical protein
MQAAGALLLSRDSPLKSKGLAPSTRVRVRVRVRVRTGLRVDF